MDSTKQLHVRARLLSYDCMTDSCSFCELLGVLRRGAVELLLFLLLTAHQKMLSYLKI
jgi:hypothetical protein